MLHYGAAGCILKSTDKAEVERTIADVMSGKNYFSPNLSGEVFQKLMAKQRQQVMTGDVLTLREKEILGLICRQLTTGEISETLFISVKTVETHRGELLQKTKSKNVAGLVLWAIRNGYCDEL
jgi:DNA-binding NarL/FixJ family response regulator